MTRIAVDAMKAGIHVATEVGGAASIEEWKMYNPTQFEYNVWESSNANYILEGSSISNTYFVSAYSKQDVFEDRAEIFSYLLN